MTAKQKVLKAIYPFLVAFNRLTGKNSSIISNIEKIRPVESLYDLSIVLNDGSRLALNVLRGKKIMFVNTASDCGYTGQYIELQKLHQQNKERVMVIGFPANDFNEQEKRTDEEIEKFCTINFGVSFPLAAKSTVIRSPQQNTVYRWLTDKRKNGWNNKQPSWNFAKYIIDEEGNLTHYFDPAISPQSDQIAKALTN